MQPKILNVETKYQGWARFLVADVRLSGGQQVRREIEDHGSAVAVLPYDPERKTAILVRQFRAPVFFRKRQEQTVEAIAGIQEEPDTAGTARREALEEAGLDLLSIEHVATVWTMPGISTEQMTLYLATYRHSARAKPAGASQGGREEISTVEIELSELDGLMKSNGIEDMKTLALVQALKLRHGDLFA